MQDELFNRKTAHTLHFFLWHSWHATIAVLPFGYADVVEPESLGLEALGDVVGESLFVSPSR